jgi:hypothetical protein
MLSLAFKCVESQGVAGDYAEFGVWMGRARMPQRDHDHRGQVRVQSLTDARGDARVPRMARAQSGADAGAVASVPFAGQSFIVQTVPAAR